MSHLALKRVKYIALHTGAHAKETFDLNGKTIHTAIDTSYDEIKRWHLDRGFNDFGYHGLVSFDGAFTQGRALNKTGAQIKGLNSASWGLCITGHGDWKQWTVEQYVSTIRKVREWQRLVLEACGAQPRLIGHREARVLIHEGLLHRRYYTSKSCPGNLIDMNVIRKVMNELPNTWEVLDDATLIDASNRIISLSA
jgi:hypothetical protein